MKNKLLLAVAAGLLTLAAQTSFAMETYPLTDSVGLVYQDYDMSGENPHTCLDILYDPGTTICTPIDGVVKVVEEEEPNHFFVLITSDTQGDAFIFANLGEVLVSKGDTVKPGDEVGIMGDTYLHVEYMPQGFGGGEPADPTPLLNEGGTKLEYIENQ